MALVSPSWHQHVSFAVSKGGGYWSSMEQVSTVKGKLFAPNCSNKPDKVRGAGAKMLQIRCEMRCVIFKTLKVLCTVRGVSSKMFQLSNTVPCNFMQRTFTAQDLFFPSCREYS